MRYESPNWFNNAYYISGEVTGSPDSYTFSGVDSSDDTKVRVYPKPDGVYSLRFDLIAREAELSSSSDTTVLPKNAIIHAAIALLARERGETGGTTAQDYFLIADKHLSDAIALDAYKNPEEFILHGSIMAQERQNIYISAPGFKGLNTADSPVTQEPSFASVAENAVIDKYGRIASRKGLNTLTSSTTPLGSSIGIETIFEYVDQSGDKVVFSAGNNKIFTGTTSLTDITPSGYSITANNWKIINFNNHAFFWQRGFEYLIYTDEGGSGVLEAASDHSHATGTAPQANEALAAFGRVWAADAPGNKHTLYWSDLLAGHAWTGGSSGSLDVTTVWPTGHDEIVALAEFNNLLVIFGKRNILLYSGADTPSSMVLQDVITNIGCTERDSVQSIGTDLFFLSDTGVRSLGRVIQEKSNPIGNVSKNVKDTMMISVNSEALNIKSVYSPEESLYLLFLPTSFEVYAFDTRGALEDGSHRATTWEGNKILCGARTSDGVFILRQCRRYK